MKLILSFVFAFFVVLSFGQTTITRLADLDNSMYSESVDLSNGQGPELFVGTTNSNNMRRMLVRFDIGSIPMGATINNVELTLNCIQSQGTQPVDLHEALADWGEGASIAGPPGGMGAPAQLGDATWGFRLWNTNAWTTPGGDFDANVSASSLSTSGSNSVFSGAALIADVQGWVDGTAINFGWMGRGNETSSGTAARFNSGESASNPPLLEVTYTPPISPCATQDTLSGNIATGTYTYMNQLVSDGMIQSGSTVLIEAKELVDLLPNFEVFLMGDLEIKVDTCQ